MGASPRAGVATSVSGAMKSTSGLKEFRVTSALPLITDSEQTSAIDRRQGTARQHRQAGQSLFAYSTPAPWPSLGTPSVVDLGNHGSSHDWTNGRDLLEPSASSHD